ncbi:CPBP family intramembrane glutamic endopeptidase [Vaginella massiliensis]|uniref:CPBP family intramembrane glutamic endopeptidase n=1 Tax=Vaginella massiliensis TaxID=1816680 RepID=UPI00083907E7|nr:type II CAAX endopeptidase family protein [Vaginella massiliensis]
MNNLKLSDKTSLQFTPIYAILVGFAITFTIQLVQGLVALPGFFYAPLYHVLLPLAFFASTVACILLLKAWFKVSTEEIKSWIFHPTSIRNYLLGFLIYILALPFAEFTTSKIPTDIPFLKDLYQQFTESFGMMMDYKIAAFLTVCILAPIFEEIIFRGFILRGMLKNGSNPWVAIVLSGLIFGAAHLNPWQFIGAGILGAVFGYVYYRTQSLLLCILLHAINNTISFVLMLKYQTIEENIFDPSATSLIMACLVLSLAAGYYLYKKTPNRQWN